MKIKTIFNLEKEVNDKLDEFAKEKFIYKSKLVNALIKDYLDKNYQPTNKKEKKS